MSHIVTGTSDCVRPVLSQLSGTRLRIRLSGCRNRSRGWRAWVNLTCLARHAAVRLVRFTTTECRAASRVQHFDRDGPSVVYGVVFIPGCRVLAPDVLGKLFQSFPNAFGHPASELCVSQGMDQRGERYSVRFHQPSDLNGTSQVSF